MGHPLRTDHCIKISTPAGRVLASFDGKTCWQNSWCKCCACTRSRWYLQSIDKSLGWRCPVHKHQWPGVAKFHCRDVSKHNPNKSPHIDGDLAKRRSQWLVGEKTTIARRTKQSHFRTTEETGLQSHIVTPRDQHLKCFAFGQIMNEVNESRSWANFNFQWLQCVRCLQKFIKAVKRSWDLNGWEHFVCWLLNWLN